MRVFVVRKIDDESSEFVELPVLRCTNKTVVVELAPEQHVYLKRRDFLNPKDWFGGSAWHQGTKTLFFNEVGAVRLVEFQRENQTARERVLSTLQRPQLRVVR